MNKEKRPFLVTLLCLGVLILMIFNGVRLGSAIAQWDLLLDLMPRPGPLYIVATGLIWTLGWLTVYLSLYLVWQQSLLIVLAVSILYAIYYWFDRLVFQALVERSNIVFALVAIFLCLTFVGIVLALPKSRKYFEKVDERELPQKL